MSDIVVLCGGSHPELAKEICRHLDIDPTPLVQSRFSNGETNVKVGATVRKKRVYIIQTGGVNANDSLMELLILISACKSASADSVTVVLPLFPYSRQAEVKDALRATTAQISSTSNQASLQSVKTRPESYGGSYISTPAPPTRAGVGLKPLPAGINSPAIPHFSIQPSGTPRNPDLANMELPAAQLGDPAAPRRAGTYYSAEPSAGCAENGSGRAIAKLSREFEMAVNTGYKFWIAQSGPFVSMLLNTAGADHIITMDLHDPQFQGFFDIPVDNLRSQPLLELYISKHIVNYEDAVIVSPDAGGARLAASIADRLGLAFALLHKDRRNNTTILVGDLVGRPAIIIDDLVDTGRTIVRAAKLAKEHGASKIYALVIHGVFAGNAVDYIAHSPITKLVTTDSVPSHRVSRVLGERYDCIDVSAMFAEAIRRIHNGESISMQFEPRFQVTSGRADQEETTQVTTA